MTVISINGIPSAEAFGSLTVEARALVEISKAETSGPAVRRQASEGEFGITFVPESMRPIDAYTVKLASRVTTPGSGLPVPLEDTTAHATVQSGSGHQYVLVWPEDAVLPAPSAQYVGRAIYVVRL